MLPLLFAGFGILGTAAVVANWSKIKSWLKDELIPGIRRWAAKLADAVAHGAEMFVQIKGKVCEFVHKLYYQEDGKWQEVQTVRTIPESEVPAHILAKAKAHAAMTNVTSEMEEVLEMELC